MVQAPGARDEQLLSVCKMLVQKVEYFDWVGFYFVNWAKRELFLGPFVGAPTEHVWIPFGKGICGQAAEKLDTVIVADVSRESNYLSCSIHVKAEIVVPIFKNGQLAAVVDIDSHIENPVTLKDKAELELLCQQISVIF